jgi:Methyladenine glycosylase
VPADWFGTPVCVRPALQAMTVSNDHWTYARPRWPTALSLGAALSATEYLAYHDNEWGRPLTSVQGLYERMTLEAFQSGLSWITVPRKRENFRRAFAAFDPGRPPPSPRMTSRDCCVIQASSETAPNHGSHRKRPARCRSWPEVFRADALGLRGRETIHLRMGRRSTYGLVRR